jgi:hypothetical protein
MTAAVMRYLFCGLPFFSLGAFQSEVAQAQAAPNKRKIMLTFNGKGDAIPAVVSVSLVDRSGNELSLEQPTAETGQGNVTYSSIIDSAFTMQSQQITRIKVSIRFRNGASIILFLAPTARTSLYSYTLTTPSFLACGPIEWDRASYRQNDLFNGKEASVENIIYINKMLTTRSPTCNRFVERGYRAEDLATWKLQHARHAIRTSGNILQSVE